MKYPLVFLKQHPFIVLHIIILAAAFFSFRYFIERLLFPVIGMGWAYLVDQITPLVITIIVGLFLLKRKTNLATIHTKLKSHYRLLFFLFIAAFVVHLGILYQFFWADEVNVVLRPITQNLAFEFHKLGSASMRGHFIASYAFLYLVFGTQAMVYPLFSIIYLATSTLFVYWFIYLLTNKRLIAGLAAIFFATTPAYLDMFSWHTTAHAPTLIMGLLSFISLLYYKKRGVFIYYILSLMFFFVAIKIGFVRSAGFTFVPPLLLLLPLYKPLKQKPLFVIIHWLPYIMITLYFVLFEFIHQELVNLLWVVRGTGSLSSVFDFLIGYRGVDSSTLLLKFIYFTVHLFIPSGLVAEVLPFFRKLFPETSIVLSLGIFICLSILCTFFIILKSKYTKERLLVFFTLSFVILNMLHNVIGFQAADYFSPTKDRFAELLDRQFSREDAGYGPGSRYIFTSTVGVGLLFALFIAWLVSKGRKLIAVAILFFIIVIGGNTYFTVRAQVQNFKGMRLYKSLVENIFKLVPRDGKPKLLLSFDREQNPLERKFGGWQWLHGFYKEGELYYTKDLKEASVLIENSQYARENLYAFYYNPHTLTFSNISDDARNYFYSNSENIQRKTPLMFSPGKGASTDRMFTGAGDTIFLERAVIKSLELGMRNIAPQKLHFKMKLKRLENPPLPFSDAVLIEEDKSYPYNFPLALWERVTTPPQMIKKAAAKFYDIPSLDQKHSELLNIAKERDSLMAGTSINIKNFTYNEADTYIAEEEQKAIQFLIDGFYTTYPNPKEEEYYSISKGSPVTLTLYFPHKTEVRRILLNTPISYSSMSPKNITVFGSSDNTHFDEVITIENATPAGWSPNHGKMYHIDFDKQSLFLRNKKIDVSALRLTITGISKKIVLDEIVVDNENALKYTPQEIHERTRNAYHYVNSKELLDQLAHIKRYNQLTLLWACAEDPDWQKQLKNKAAFVDGIWYSIKVNIPPEAGYIDDKITINCYGSKLRNIFFVSPPYPVEMELVEAVLE